MIDLGLLRDQPERIITLLQRKDPKFDARLLEELDKQVRSLRQQIEELQHEKNELAKQAQKGISQEIREQSRSCSVRIKELEERLAQQEQEFHALYLSCPNVPSEDLPVGGKESNKVVKLVGMQQKFSFEPKHHVALGEALGWLDFAAGTRVAGSNFAYYYDDAVKMLYALTQIMLRNNQEHGYRIALPPAIVSEKSLEVTGNLPKFKDQVYRMPDDGMYLSPTAEVPLANAYREHIFALNELPVRLTAWTSCFRREAGTYGAHERGLIRIHQFEKAELYAICEPQKSSDELDRMVACAEAILQKLNLHYRISLLAGGDCSFASAKTYDIEVWLPGQKAYYEVSSCSNCTDFQARRGLIRYREAEGAKAKLTHTLNGSSLALPRLMVAIMETYQQEDGSIALPAILKEAMTFY